ncbi:MAG: AI-2E family transporter [Nanoarchaeota archaeon]
MGLTTNIKVWKILIFIFVLLSIFFYIIFYFKTIFLTILLGIVLIILTQELKTDFNKRLKKYNFNNFFKKIVGYFFIGFWIFILIFLFGMSINEFIHVFQNIESNVLTNAYNNHFAEFIPDILKENLFEFENIREVEKILFSYTTTIISQLSIFIFNSLLIIPIMFYFFFKRKDEIYKNIESLIPDKFHKGVVRVSKEVANKLYNFLTAKVIESIFIAVICCFGFYVFGLKGWLILGIIAGFFNIIPYFGPIIGSIPAIIVGYLDDPTFVIYVLITIIIAQLVDNFYLIPFMITGKVNVNPFIGVILILAGAKLFGVFGMIFSIPIYLIYKIILREAYIEIIKFYKIKN